MTKKIHPLLSALLGELQTDDAWPLERRVTWLKMAAMAFDLVHGRAGPIGIDAPPLMSFGADVGVLRPSGDVVDFGRARAAVAMPALKPGDAAVRPPLLDRPLQGDQTHYIDLSGRVFARELNDFGVPIGLGAHIHHEALPPDATLWDMRPGEAALNALEWADGSRRAPPGSVQVLTG